MAMYELEEEESMEIYKHDLLWHKPVDVSGNKC
jgi:hypothetical protein